MDYSDNLASASSSSFACFGSLPVQIMQSLSSELEKQRLEMDWFLQMENKRLRRSILEEETRQKALLMRKYESRIKILMLQKDEELAFARNKTRELQDFLTRAEMEAKAWEKKATEKEAIVSDLNNRLNQVKMKDDDAVSFWDNSEKKVMMKGRCCKLCQARSLCVVFFPCRHLCCCKSCEPLLGQCPVCETVKEASLEVFWVKK
ncbi:hypothetical protein DH2020_034957 [Rehmannia glutinosa]|uniref:RING-type domain-containing protein n=1 Tax=Rehmannia glutinosa TaxID=99300 RepID=A0ABR0VB90_REHGL